MENLRIMTNENIELVEESKVPIESVFLITNNEHTDVPLVATQPEGMKYGSYEQTVFTYTCTECGNQFSKPYECFPYRCHDCDEEDCFEEEVEDVTVITQYCPICERYFDTSSYLNSVIEDERVRWLANMVTHYRHSHTKSWDNMWGRNGDRYLKGWKGYKDHDIMKMEYNERAKRQILRKCKIFLIENGFTVEHVMELESTDDMTIELYEKILGNKVKQLFINIDETANVSSGG